MWSGGEEASIGDTSVQSIEEDEMVSTEAELDGCHEERMGEHRILLS